MSTVYLNIGSNLGDRHALIEQAVALICARWPQARCRCSVTVESEPWGYDSHNIFLNLGVALDFDECPDPLILLDSLQEIERKVGCTPHRNADGTYRDRYIDIDIIAIDKLVIKDDRLVIPHPRAALRPFVIYPLIQLAPSDLIEFITENNLS